MGRPYQAGEFEAPPAMLEEIGAWITKIYASHLLSKVEPEITRGQDPLKPLKDALNEMETNLRSLPRLVSKVKPGKSLRVPVYWTGTQARLHHKFYGVKVQTAMQWTDEGDYVTSAPSSGPEKGKYIFEFGEGDRRITFEWGRNTEAEAVQYLEENLSGYARQLRRVVELLEKRDSVPGAPRNLDDLIELRKELKKHTTKAKGYRSRSTKKFKINLDGWKYARPNSPIIQKANENISRWNGMIDSQVALAKKTLPMAQKAYDLWHSGDTQGAREILEKLSKTTLTVDPSLPPWEQPTPRPAWSRYDTDNAIHAGQRPSELMGWVKSDQGWRRVPLKEVEAQRKVPLDPDDLVRGLESRHWDGITVILSFIPAKQFAGTWKTFDRQLQVQAPQGFSRSVETFREDIRGLRRVLRHELQHAGQDILAHLEGVLGGATGLPPRKTRTPGKSPNDHSILHDLRDVEYHPVLSDQVEEFVDRVQRVAVEDRKIFFRNWVRGKHYMSREFFGESFKQYPAKWKVAVGEFWKRVREKGVEFPSDSLPRVASPTRVASHYLRSRHARSSHSGR